MSDRSRWDPEMAAFTAEQEKAAAAYPPVKVELPLDASPPGQRSAGHADGSRRAGDGGDDGPLRGCAWTPDILPGVSAGDGPGCADTGLFPWRRLGVGECRYTRSDDEGIRRRRSGGGGQRGLCAVAGSEVSAGAGGMRRGGAVRVRTRGGVGAGPGANLRGRGFGRRQSGAGDGAAAARHRRAGVDGVSWRTIRSATRGSIRRAIGSSGRAGMG